MLKSETDFTSTTEEFNFSLSDFTINKPEVDLYFLPLNFPFPGLTDFFLKSKGNTSGKIFFNAKTRDFAFSGISSITLGMFSIFSIELYLDFTNSEDAVEANPE